MAENQTQLPNFQILSNFYYTEGSYPGVGEPCKILPACVFKVL